MLGYIDDRKKTRFGLAFGPPPREPKQAQPQSLLSLLGSGKVSLGQRVAVAQQLAQSLLYLHAVNWLHKGFRSASILFFRPAGSTTVESPYISGFEYSRPGDSGAATTTGPPQDRTCLPYIHPEYMDVTTTGGFRKTYDVYSLGIVLIELALWRPINQVLGFTGTPELDDQARAGASEDGDHSKHNVEHVKQTPMKELRCIRTRILGENVILDRVGFSMSDRYRDAVKACSEGMVAFGLTDDTDQTDPVIAMLLQHAFIRVVVEALKSIVV